MLNKLDCLRKSEKRTHMNIDLSNTEVNITETNFEYGVMFKYNIISSADNIQYKITSEFTPK